MRKLYINQSWRAGIKAFLKGAGVFKLNLEEAGARAGKRTLRKHLPAGPNLEGAGEPGARPF